MNRAPAAAHTLRVGRNAGATRSVPVARSTRFARFVEGARETCLARLASLAAASLVAVGCTTLAPRAPVAGEETLSGRLAVRIDAVGGEAARSFSGAFDLRGDAHSGSLGLATPLGTRLAEARWTPLSVTLATPQSTRTYPSLDALTHDVLGESIPVAAWFDWLHGRPWPEAPSTRGPADDQRFEQMGWTVDVARLGEGSVRATRAEPLPTVTVQIRVDR